MSSTLSLFYFADTGAMSNYQLDATLSLQAALTKRLSLQLSYEYELDNTPAPSGLGGRVKERDSSLQLGLAFAFGAKAGTPAS